MWKVSRPNSWSCLFFVFQCQKNFYHNLWFCFPCCFSKHQGVKKSAPQKSLCQKNISLRKFPFKKIGNRFDLFSQSLKQRSDLWIWSMSELISLLFVSFSRLRGFSQYIQVHEWESHQLLEIILSLENLLLYLQQLPNK